MRIEHVSASGSAPARSCSTTSRSTSRRASSCACSARRGCGKSTLLNLIAGLDRPTSGHDRDAGRGRGGDVPGVGAHAVAHRAAQRRARPASARRPPRASAARRRCALLDTVNLADAAEKRPHELSGGMRQRVALARALAQDRPVLLMDEPFAALDAITRDLLHEELERVWRATGRTIVFVTHNVREAARLGQRVDPAHEPPRARRRASGASRRPTAGASSRPRSRRCRSRSPTSCGRRSAAMPREAQLEPTASATRERHPRIRRICAASKPGLDRLQTSGGPAAEPLAAHHGERPAAGRSSSSS